MRDLTQPPPGIKRSVIQLKCEKCGRETHANCDCGMNYVPVRERAAEAVRANPEKSNRAIADEHGFHPEVVRRARADTGVSTETVTGKDGKTYPATKPQPREKTMTPESEVNAKLSLQIIDAGYKAIVAQLSAPEAIKRLERARDWASDNLRSIGDGFIPM